MVNKQKKVKKGNKTVKTVMVLGRSTMHSESQFSIFVAGCRCVIKRMSKEMNWS